MFKYKLVLAISLFFCIMSACLVMYEVFYRGFISTVDLAVYRRAGYDIVHSVPLYSSNFGEKLNVKLGYVYPPISAIIFIPFGFLSMTYTKWIWSILSIFELFVVVKIGFHEVSKSYKKLQIPFLFFFTGLFLWINPMYSDLIYGQIDLLIMTLILIDLVYFVDHKRPKWLKEGLLTGLAAALKLVPLIFILYFLLVSDYKKLKNSIISFSVFTLAGFLIMPNDSKIYWFHYLEYTGGHDNAWYYLNQSADGILRRILASYWFELWVPLVALIFIFGIRKAYVANKNNNEFLAVILIGLTGIIISPISWVHELVWIIPAIGYILNTGKTKQQVGAAVTYFIFTLFNLPYIGDNLINHYHMKALGYFVENEFGISLIVILVLLTFSKRAPKRNISTQVLASETINEAHH